MLWRCLALIRRRLDRIVVGVGARRGKLIVEIERVVAARAVHVLSLLGELGETRLGVERGELWRTLHLDVVLIEDFGTGSGAVVVVDVIAAAAALC